MGRFRGYNYNHAAMQRRINDQTQAKRQELAALEGQEQAAFIERVKLHYARYPELRWLRSFPNEALWGPGTNRLRAQGAAPGPLDILFPQPRGLYVGLWIEFKRQGEGRWSQAQIDYGRQMLAWGWCVTEARTAEEGWGRLTRYLELPPRAPCPVELEGLEVPGAVAAE